MILLRNAIISFLFFLLPYSSSGYGVLTHEAIIDAAWDKSIVPFLKNKFPFITAEALTQAHAYAYGGAVAPDMGYYPRGSEFFTDLVHYVRSGDMMTALFDNANTPDEYAFAIGFLSHYSADCYGHPLATNRSVGLIYPKLEKKFGTEITYADDEIAHVRTEFGFDVLQVAKGNYASQSYRDFIGFKVDTGLLSKAFIQTYGLDINDVFNGHFNGSVETFRWVVANVFPLITRSAWAAKKSTILKQNPKATARSFRYKMRIRNYNKIYGKGYSRPGFFPSALSLFIRILPKVGPLKALKFKVPDSTSEKYFVESFDSILHHFIADICRINSKTLSLSDRDLDTGKPTAACEYILADKTYTALVLKLSENEFAHMDKTLQNNIVAHCAAMKNNFSGSDSKKCNQFYSAAEKLKNFQTVAAGTVK